MPRTSLDPSAVAAATARLSDADQRAPEGRQPVHTCYVPADGVTASTLADWGAQALAALHRHAPTPADLARILAVPDALAEVLHGRVRAKLAVEPVEDLRIDFEDGYGTKPTEDDDAERTAGIVRTWLADRTAPARFGLRMKSFDTKASRDRGIRTLDVFLTALGEVPPNFVITFPKVTSVAQVEVFGDILDMFGQDLRFEIQVETTQSIVDGSGRLAIPAFIEAGRGRVTGLHFGTYDYTAGCGLGASHQHLAHEACDFARNVMQVCAAGTGVALSDGSTNVLPVGDNVEHGWRTHYELVRRSLAHGFYQGWDLHPAQLVTRYAAVHAYYLEGAEADAERLKAYVERSGGAVLDEPATAQALSASFLRALDCAALEPDEVRRLTGLDIPALRALARRTPIG
ncbi:citrate lyase beta subunit [Saccharothrix tamanrassetensis]|uniref:Citrate lyase beta subunit n=1 Tax=Saccharothrix tamanrassetensis TaxID=1051531 RepID=A0A841CGM5_9PSEU|nr:aldolase [Saccharothrix tamanrassetensis]MBB5955514.1 citrate lyase beta subunit [Saccharothrix tamanrassetensis]